MKQRQVGIVFCGGCNPRIDRGAIAAGVRAVLQADGCRVRFNTLDVDFIIYLSGCSANCALKYNGSPLPAIIVAATTVDAVQAAEGEIVALIVARVRNFYPIGKYNFPLG